MTVLILIICIVVFLFGVIVFFGAPYLPTMRPQINAAFELLELKKGQTLLELGCGDGRVLLEAVARGYTAIGIELNLALVVVALWRTRHYRDKVKIVWGNYWSKPWPPSDGVFTFLIDSFMPKLDEHMRKYGGKLASVAFKIPNESFKNERNGVYLYYYDKPLA